MALPESIESIIEDVHHLAIVVGSLAEARPLYEGVFGMRAPEPEPEHVAEQRVNVLVLYAGTTRIELIEPASPDSPVSKFLDTKGGGLHHVAYRVADLERAIAHLMASGVRMIDESPQKGSHGTRVAFVHPAATGRVLIELVEDPTDHD